MLLFIGSLIGEQIRRLYFRCHIRQFESDGLELCNRLSKLFSFLRIIRAAEDDTTRIVAGTIMVWLVGQGFLNIAVVLGLMPVLGVPLPFVSAGGTALVSCLVAVGVVLSFARTQGRNTL